MSKLLDEHMKDMDAMKAEVDKAMNCYAESLATRKVLLKENQRLKECAEMGLEANAEKAKEIKRLKEALYDLVAWVRKSYTGKPLSEVLETAEHLLAAQPQGGSDE